MGFTDDQLARLGDFGVKMSTQHGDGLIAITDGTVQFVPHTQRIDDVSEDVNYRIERMKTYLRSRGGIGFVVLRNFSIVSLIIGTDNN